MATKKSLLEVYEQYRDEIEILSNEKTLFVLVVIRQLRNPLVQKLTEFLGWELEDVMPILTELQEVDVVKVADISATSPRVTLLPKGHRILSIFEEATQGKVPERLAV
jgi:hypothetical protein